LGGGASHDLRPVPHPRPQRGTAIGHTLPCKVVRSCLDSRRGSSRDEVGLREWAESSSTFSGKRRCSRAYLSSTIRVKLSTSFAASSSFLYLDTGGNGPVHTAAICSNKAVIDRRLRPRAATWEVTLSARKVVPSIRFHAAGNTAHIL